MKRKYAKIAIALAAAVTISTPGAVIPGNTEMVMADELTEKFTEIGSAADLTSAIQTGTGNYRLTADLTGNLGLNVPANSNFTIDLNGHKMYVHWNLFQSGTSLHIIDSSTKQTGTMSSWSSRLFYIGSNVNLTIDGGNYICDNPKTDFMFNTTTTSGSRIEINGGRFNMNNVGTAGATAMFSNFVVANAQTVINGGSFSAIDGTYVFRGKTNQSIAEALKNVTINGGTFGPNALDIKNTTPEGPKAYFTDSEEETELSADQQNIFNACSSIRLTDDFLVTSVVLNGSDLGQSGKEITLNPDSLKIGNGEDGKNELVVTDFEGVSNTYIFYIDNIAPEVIETSISPDNSQLHYGPTTFTFETSEPIQSPGDGWTDVSEKTDGTKWEKEFDSNQKFTLTLTDLAGNTAKTKRYEIKNIENKLEISDPSYDVTGPTQGNVTVTFKTSVECKTPSGWERTPGSSKRNSFQKVYTENAEEEIKVTSLGGQEATVNISITNIDREAPALDGKIQVSPDNSQMSTEKVVSFEANEPVVSPGEGWEEVPDSQGTKWQKVYTKAMKDSISLTDLAGNTSDPIRFEVKRIEDVQLAAEVSYSNEGQYTNQDVVVTIKTNVECKTPEGWEQTGNKRNQFEKTFSADAVETVKFVSLGGQTLEQEITVSGIDKQAPAAYINGTQMIDPNTVYSDNVSLKFSDNLALNKYELNGHMSPTNIAGNKWGDGNYQNIKNYLNLNGENTLTVWDMAGNQAQYVFTIDQTAPVIEVIIEKPDIVTPSKIVTLKGDEPFKVIPEETHKLTFTPHNDDDGDGYATEWRASAVTTIQQGYTVEDIYGNQYTVPITVSNVDSLKPSVTFEYSDDEPVKTDVFVFMNWNTAPSAEVEERLFADGWKKVNGLRYYREFRKNETLVYTNITSHSGVPGEDIIVEVKNILCDVGVNYYIQAEEKYVEGRVEVLSDAATVNTDMLTDVPEGYEIINPGEVQINDGWIYVELQKIVTTKEIGVNYWDTENNVQAGEGKVTVAADAYKVNTSALTDIPEGYELTSVGDIQINDGWIYVEVKKVVTTKEIGVNYWDTENNVQAGEGKVTVAADAYKVNTSALTDIPEGYELTSVGDIQINDGWIYVEVKKVVTTKEIGVNYYISAEDRYVEGKVIVDKDATEVDLASLTDIPEGYKVISASPAMINDGWIYVELQTAESGMAATLQVNFVGPFGESIDVAPVVAVKTGPEGEWVDFNYGVDWKLPTGYTFAYDFDETAAKQTIRIKYGETLDTLTIGIVAADFSDGIL